MVKNEEDDQMSLRNYLSEESDDSNSCSNNNKLFLKHNLNISKQNDIDTQ